MLHVNPHKTLENVHTKLVIRFLGKQFSQKRIVALGWGLWKGKVGHLVMMLHRHKDRHKNRHKDSSSNEK